MVWPGYCPLVVFRILSSSERRARSIQQRRHSYPWTLVSLARFEPLSRATARPQVHRPLPKRSVAIRLPVQRQAQRKGGGEGGDRFEETKKISPHPSGRNCGAQRNVLALLLACRPKTFFEELEFTPSYTHIALIGVTGRPSLLSRLSSRTGRIAVRLSVNSTSSLIAVPSPRRAVTATIVKIA